MWIEEASHAVSWSPDRLHGQTEHSEGRGEGDRERQREIELWTIDGRRSRAMVDVVCSRMREGLVAVSSL